MNVWLAIFLAWMAASVGFLMGVIWRTIKFNPFEQNARKSLSELYGFGYHCVQNPKSQSGHFWESSDKTALGKWIIGHVNDIRVGLRL